MPVIDAAQEALLRRYQLWDWAIGPGGAPIRRNGVWLRNQGVRAESPNYLIEEGRLGTARTMQPGRCGLFDGSNDFVFVGLTGSWRPNALVPFAVSFWIYRTSGTQSSPIADQKNGAYGFWDVWLNYAGAGSIQLSMAQASGKSLWVETAAGQLTANTWRHVCCVYDGGLLATGMSIYVDGVKVPTPTSNQTMDAAWVYNADAALMIGAQQNGTFASPTATTPFAGKLFDVRLYSRALTVSEVANIYNTSRPGGKPETGLYPAHLVGHWKLDDVHDDRAYDSSGNDYHGQKYNVTLASYHYTGTDVPFSWQDEAGYSENLSVVYSTAFAAATGWTLDTGVTISGGTLNFATASDNYAQCDTALTVGRRYRIRAQVTSWTSGNISVGIHNGTTMRSVDVTDQAGAVDVTIASQLTGTPKLRIIGGANGVGGTNVWDNLTITDVGPYPQDSSTQARDIFNNALTYAGPAPRDALMKQSHCATFDGTNDFASIASTSAFAYEYNLPFSVHFRIKTADTTDSIILGKKLGSGTYRGWDVSMANATARTYFELCSDVAGEVRLIRSIPSTLLTDNVWHDVTITYDGSGNRTGIVWWVDGIAIPMVDGGSATLAATAVSAAVLTVSGVDGTATYPFTASVADARIYSSKLTDADILLLSQGRETTAVPAGHWPMAEGNGATLYDVAGSGHHMTVTGSTETSFWGTKQNVYHRNIAKGFGTRHATGAHRTLNGTTQYFSIADNAALSGSDAKWWWAAYVRKTSTAAGEILSKWDNIANKREYLFGFTNATTARLSVSGNGIATAVVNTTGVFTNTWALIFGYHDSVANTISLAVNNGAFATPIAHTTGIYNSDIAFNVGRSLSSGAGADLFVGDIGMIAMGKANTATFEAIRTAIYNSGAIMEYAALTTAQKTDWGLISWWDCDEFVPVLWDKYSTNHLTGTAMPLIPAKRDLLLAADAGAITCPAGAWHNGAETQLDFTAGVTSPWTDATRLGITLPTAYRYRLALPNGMSKTTTGIVEHHFETQD